MNNETLKNLEFIQITRSSGGRAKNPRPRRQVKKAQRRSYCYVENIFGRQRRHRALQPAAVEWVVWIHSIIKNKPNFRRFSPENEDFTQKQTQFKANSNPILFFPVAKPDKRTLYYENTENLIIFEVLL